jgi:acyl carrier protein
MDELLQELKALLNKTLPAVNTDNVTMKSDLRTDLAIDSFNMILLAISIENHFNIKLDETFVPKSVEDVCEYIQRKQECSQEIV